MNDLRNAMIQSQINQHYPNARIVSYQDPDSGLQFYTEAQLQQLREDWFPLSCHIDPETDRLVFGGRSDVAHTYTIGETGAGKTTRFVMQSVRALACMPDKPSFLITDIHGEIIENLYPHLKQNGYTVRILNCDDPQHSDTYNPFEAMAKNCKQTGQIDTECHNMIRKIAEIIQPVQSTQDPIWDIGARSYTHGCILDKFEALIDGQIPLPCVTLYNIIENHYWLRRELGDHGSINHIPYYDRKPDTALSLQKMIATTENAEKTRRSYWGVVENHYDNFGQPSLYQLSSNSTIDVEEFLDTPTAIIVQSGASSCADHLVSLMVNDIYTAVVRKGRQQRSKRLSRPIHCFLDEFANCQIADGPSFIKMLTTSRKFGMHWHMLLQSDAQIERKYDTNIASIVRSNCTEIFLGSFDHDTAVRFAISCGKKTMESLATRLTQQAPVLECIDLLTADRLNLMEPGEVYVRSRRHPLLKTYYEAFYNCQEYAVSTDLDAIYPENNFDYTQTAFFPDDVNPVTDQDMVMLEYLNSNGPCQESALNSLMTPLQLRRSLLHLRTRNLIKQTDADDIAINITPWHMELLREQVRQRQEQERKKQQAKEARAKQAQQEVASDQTMPPVVHTEHSQSDDTDSLFSRLRPRTMDQVLRMPGFLTHSLENVVGYTCIPEELADNMMQIARGADAETLPSSVQAPRILKFEIIETFLGAHDFVTKEEWVAALQAEVQGLEKEGWFVDEIMQTFRDALKEIDADLTLGNILEIKRIIADTN